MLCIRPIVEKISHMYAPIERMLSGFLIFLILTSATMTNISPIKAKNAPEKEIIVKIWAGISINQTILVYVLHVNTDFAVCKEKK